MANYAQDENMINAYKQGKDLYATIASHIYHNDYWDNMEHTESGEPNAEGKKRRSSVKGLLLGWHSIQPPYTVMYIEECDELRLQVGVIL